MGRNLRTLPVAPAIRRTGGLRLDDELCRAGHQPIGFAECVQRDGVAAELDLHGMAVEQRAATEQAPLAVTPGARERNLLGGCCEDGLEISPIGEIHRQRIDLRRGDDVVRDEPVVRDAAGPARGVEPDEAYVGTRASRECARRHPSDGDAGFQAVIVFEAGQRRVNCRGGSGE